MTTINGGKMENLVENWEFSGDLRDELDLLNLCFGLQSCTKNSTCGIGVAWIWKYKKQMWKKATHTHTHRQSPPLSTGVICSHLNQQYAIYAPIWPFTMCRFSWLRATPLRERPDLYHTRCTHMLLLIVLPSGEEYGKLHDKEEMGLKMARGKLVFLFARCLMILWPVINIYTCSLSASIRHRLSARGGMVSQWWL